MVFVPNSAKLIMYQTFDLKKIPAIGFDCSFPTDIVFGPIEFEGRFMLYSF